MYVAMYIQCIHTHIRTAATLPEIAFFMYVIMEHTATHSRLINPALYCWH